MPSVLPTSPTVPAMVVATSGGRLGLVDNWKSTVVLLPSGFTLALSVAVVPEMAVAGSVVTTAGGAVTSIADEVVAVSPLLSAWIVYPLATSLSVKPENVATPATALTVSVPPSVAPAG